MFFKSLQLKMILIFFIFIFIIIASAGVFSIIRIEQIYYKGFVEEMQNTILSFGLNISNINEEVTYENVDAKQLEKENLNKIYNNFSIYFSLNNISRTGKILDSNNNILFFSNEKVISSNALKCIEEAKNSANRYSVYDDKNENVYLFSYVIEYNSAEETTIKYIILVEQSKEYINKQLNEVTVVYAIAVIVLSIITIIIAISFASNITKPIEELTNKAEMVANGDIEEVQMQSGNSSGYEITRLIDTFNLMTAKIRDTLNEMISEKNKLETILLHLTDGVLAFNIEGNLIHANLAAKKMFKLRGKENFEQIFGKLKIDINIEKIIYLEDWTSLEQMVTIGDLYVNIFFAPFKDEKERASGIIAVIQDTTKQAKLDDLRKEFVANVSHELKTPITSIKTYSETLLEQDLDKNNENKFLNVILEEANRMSKLVSDLLQLTKFDYKKVVWNKISFDLPELVKSVCEKHKIQAENKNQILDCFVTSNVPNVYADRDGIERVIINVLTNSIKYTKEGGSIKVYVGAVHDDAYIKIIDNGMGIPEEDIPRVFERFYRVDKARSREMGGTGLGLPIAKEIIEANDGSINIKSKLNEGTEVVIKVPIVETDFTSEYKQKGPK